MSVRTEESFDQFLIDECLAGSEAAWQLLYQRYQVVLLRLIAHLLGRARADEELTEEIADIVWCSLVDQDRQRLRAYDRTRGGFATYLRSLARQEIQRRRRPRCGRGAREVPLPADELAGAEAHLTSLQAMLEEFVPTLSSREKSVFIGNLLGNPSETAWRSLSADNLRQVKRRVKKKLRRFLYPD